MTRCPACSTCPQSDHFTFRSQQTRRGPPSPARLAKSEFHLKLVFWLLCSRVEQFSDDNAGTALLVPSRGRMFELLIRSEELPSTEVESFAPQGSPEDRDDFGRTESCVKCDVSQVQARVRTVRW